MARKVQINDGSNNAVGVTGNALDINIKSGATLEVNLDPDNDGVEIYGSDDGGTTQRVIKTDAQGELQVDILASALPTGAATETTLGTRALEAGGNLAAIKAKTDNIPAVGQAAMAASTPVAIANNQSAVPTTVAATTSGGYTPFKLISAASTNATSIKASAGQVGFLYATNVNAAPMFVKLYNKASAPTVGTDTPVLTLLIPGNATGSGGTFSLSTGVAFSTGIGLAITGVVTDADATAVAANEIVVNLGYK